MTSAIKGSEHKGKAAHSRAPLRRRSTQSHPALDPRWPTSVTLRGQASAKTTGAIWATPPAKLRSRDFDFEATAQTGGWWVKTCSRSLPVRLPGSGLIQRAGPPCFTPFLSASPSPVDCPLFCHSSHVVPCWLHPFPLHCMALPLSAGTYVLLLQLFITCDLTLPNALFRPSIYCFSAILPHFCLVSAFALCQCLFHQHAKHFLRYLCILRTFQWPFPTISLHVLRGSTQASIKLCKVRQPFRPDWTVRNKHAVVGD